MFFWSHSLRQLVLEKSATIGPKQYKEWIRNYLKRRKRKVASASPKRS